MSAIALYPLWKNIISGLTQTDEEATQAGESGGLVMGKAPENAVIIRRDVPVDVQNEDRFSPVNGFAFNPLSQEYASPDNAVLAALLFLMYRKDPKGFMRLASKYMDNVTELLTAIVNSGKTHPLTALNAAVLFGCVAHRFGVINDAHYLKIADQTRSIVDKLIQLNFADMALGGLETLVEAQTKGGEAIAGLVGKGMLPIP